MIYDEHAMSNRDNRALTLIFAIIFHRHIYYTERVVCLFNDIILCLNFQEIMSDNASNVSYTESNEAHFGENEIGSRRMWI